MKSGLGSNVVFVTDDARYRSIESSIRQIYLENTPLRILEVIENVGMLRIKDSSGTTPLWYIARHADERPQMLKSILIKFANELAVDDFEVFPNIGPFQFKSVKWLMQNAPVETDRELEILVNQTIQSFDSVFPVTRHFSNVYIPHQTSSRAGRGDFSSYSSKNKLK